MRIHQVERDGDGDAVLVRSAEAATEPLTEMAGEAVEGVRLWVREVAPWGRLEIVELAVGSGLPLHAADQFIVCQVVSGRGRLGLPDGSDIAFAAPDLLTFEPGTLHSWHGIEEATTLSICVVGS